MTDNTFHLTAEEIDRARARYWDGTAADARRLREHLDQCQDCRRRAGAWRELAAGLDRVAPRVAVAGRLRAARLAALAGGHGRKPFPRLAMAVAATMVLAVGAGLLNRLQPFTAPARPAAETGQVADLYSEIDFYVWLARQSDAPARHGNET